jgi:hypothetical protein
MNLLRRVQDALKFADNFLYRREVFERIVLQAGRL